MPGLLYSDDFFLYGESEENLRAMMGRFAEVCRRGLKINAGKSKVLNGEEGLKCVCGSCKWDSFRACLGI